MQSSSSVKKIATDLSRNSNASVPVTTALASFASKLRYQDIPTQAANRAKLCVLDLLGVVIAASATDSGSNVLRHAFRFASEGNSTALGSARKVSPSLAAMIGGTLSDILEIQDGWRFGGTHPCLVIPPAFAVAEWRAASGKSLLTAIVAGYEVTNRVAATVHPQHMSSGYMPNGTAGSIGSAAAAGSLLGLDGAAMAGALGNAGFLLPVSTAENLWAGYSVKPFHTGYAARVGVEAALLAQDGFQGCPLEGSPGIGKGFLEITTGEVDYHRALDRLGEHFTIDDVYFKFYPVCRQAHSSVQSALQLSQRLNGRLDQVDEILVHTHEPAATKLNRPVKSGAPMGAVQFSLQYIVAAALIEGRMDVEQISLQRRSDDRILSLAGKVRVVSDDEMSGRYPQMTPAKVEVRIRGGETAIASVDIPIGDPRIPVTEDEILRKFMDMTRENLPSSSAEQVVELVMSLDRAPNVDSLAAQLREIKVSV